jgi:NAD(P)-dependent dehydrogenase (short-subunit alcohol dehydrogenase family)
VSALPPGGSVLVQGASGGIGFALTRRLVRCQDLGLLFALTRDPGGAQLRALAKADARVFIVPLDVEQETSIAEAARQIGERTSKLDLLINCAGILHHESTGMSPERRLGDVEPGHLERAFRVNAIGSLLMAKAFESLLKKAEAPVFASISARVGSIGDNRLGGWYAYRASKAALNMYLKTLSIEWGRGSRPIRVLALHPGTVATPLSAPFTRGDNSSRTVFSADHAAEQLLAVIDGSRASGAFLDWQGHPVAW